MPIAQFLIMATVSVLVTLPSVLLIPRARSSPAFDRLLWGATWLLAFLFAWIAIAYADTDLSTLPLNSFVISGVPLIPTLIGAMAGALSLNVLLWMVDRFGQPTDADDQEFSTDALDEAEDAEKKPNGISKQQ